MNKEIDLEEFPLPQLLSQVCDWAYKEDRRLYENIDEVFSSHSMSNGDKLEKEILIQVSRETITDFFIAAIRQADYQDILKFTWLFINKGGREGRHVYESFENHSYIHLRPYIDHRLKFLIENNLADWQISVNHRKHSHHRYHIERLIKNEDNRVNTMYLFPVFSGNVVATEKLRLCNNHDDPNFNLILLYILNQGIVQNPHYKTIEIGDLFRSSMYNGHHLTNSINTGGYHHLLYLKTSQLKEIYKKVNKRKLTYLDKATWGYINACPKEDSSFYTKFFIYIT